MFHSRAFRLNRVYSCRTCALPSCVSRRSPRVLLVCSSSRSLTQAIQQLRREKPENRHRRRRYSRFLAQEEDSATVRENRKANSQSVPNRLDFSETSSTKGHQPAADAPADGEVSSSAASVSTSHPHAKKKPSRFLGWLMPSKAVTEVEVLPDEPQTEFSTFKSPPSYEVWSCGEGFLGALGHRNYDPQPTFKRVKEIADVPCSFVTAGWAESGAIAHDGQYFRWGWSGPLSTVFAAHRFHKAQPRIFNWLQNRGWSFASLALGTTSPTPHFRLAGYEMKQAAYGAEHFLCVTHDGFVIGEGGNTSGQLGHDGFEDLTKPALIDRLRGYDIKEVACGFRHTLFLGERGTVWASGNGRYGQLGIGVAPVDSAAEAPQNLTRYWLAHLEDQQKMVEHPAFDDIREAMENHHANFEGGEAEEAAHNESGGLESESTNSSSSSASTSETPFSTYSASRRYSTSAHATSSSSSSQSSKADLLTHTSRPRKRSRAADSPLSPRTFFTNLHFPESSSTRKSSSPHTDSSPRIKRFLSSESSKPESDTHEESRGGASSSHSNEDDSASNESASDDSAESEQVNFGDGLDDDEFAEEYLLPKVWVPKIVHVACGFRYSMLLSDEGDVFSFGHGKTGALGHGLNMRNQIFPKRIQQLDHVHVVKVSAGFHHAVALTDDGEVWTWGANRFLQCGQSLDETYIQVEEYEQSVAGLLKHSMNSRKVYSNSPELLKVDSPPLDELRLAQLETHIRYDESAITNENDPCVCLPAPVAPEIVGDFRIVDVCAGAYQTSLVTECGKTIIIGDVNRERSPTLVYSVIDLADQVEIGEKIPEFKTVQLGWRHTVALVDSTSDTLMRKSADYVSQARAGPEHDDSDLNRLHRHLGYSLFGDFSVMFKENMRRFFKVHNR